MESARASGVEPRKCEMRRLAKHPTTNTARDFNGEESAKSRHVLIHANAGRERRDIPTYPVDILDLLDYRK